MQKELRGTINCTDIRGTIKGTPTPGAASSTTTATTSATTSPTRTFLSNAPGSGNNVTWTLTLGQDPTAAPTDVDPGHDVSDWFELTPAPWFSMALCDPNSFPATACTPESDSNAPTCFGVNCGTTTQGGGSAFMEMQFYPPGNPPFVDSESCDDTHWCAALTIDSLECTATFANCNPNCEEPVNFAFIQRNGVPTGPPSPQDANLNTFVNNGETLLMNPGDKITFHMSDAPAPGGGHAFEVVINDLTTHQTGFMQASAANGFHDHLGMANCAGTPFNFQPEFNTAAKAGNIIPWAARTRSTSAPSSRPATGRRAPRSATRSPQPVRPERHERDVQPVQRPVRERRPPDSTTTRSRRRGLLRCQGDTHPGYDGPGTSTEPDQMTGCQDNVFQNGDLDFDGTPYWTEWPTGLAPNHLPVAVSWNSSPPRTAGSTRSSSSRPTSR